MLFFKKDYKKIFLKTFEIFLAPKHLAQIASVGFLSTGASQKGDQGDTFKDSVANMALLAKNHDFSFKNSYWNLEAKWIYLNLSGLEESLKTTLAWYIIESGYLGLFLILITLICFEKRGDAFIKNLNVVGFSLAAATMATMQLAVAKLHLFNFRWNGFLVYGSPDDEWELWYGFRTRINHLNNPLGLDMDIFNAGTHVKLHGLVATDYYTVILKLFLIICSLFFFLSLTIFLYINWHHTYWHRQAFLTDKNLSFFRNFILISSITHFFLLNLISSYDLLSLFVSLEGTTLCLYILSGLRTDNKLSIEAGLKYFLVSAVFSCIFGIGTFLVYLTTGTTKFYGIRESILLTLTETSTYNTNLNFLLMGGVFLILIVFLMKLGAIPYHFWIGDVYQGSPLIVTIFFATIVRIAFFGIFFRLIMFVFYFMCYSSWFSEVLFIFGFLSIIFGGIISLAQTELKRFLAYSSIVHTGFILLGLSSMDYFGFKSALVYLFIYIITLLFFLLIIFLFPIFDTKFISEGKVYVYRSVKYFSDLNKFPILVRIVLISLLFSMAGIPPLPGFMIKLYILKSSFFYLLGTIKLYSILNIFSISFFFMLLLFFFIILISVLTSYNYIRLITIMSLDMKDSILAYKPQDYYSFVFNKTISLLLKWSSYGFLLLIAVVNFSLIFFIGDLYNSDSGLFNSLLSSVRHPFFNKQLALKEVELAYEYLFGGPHCTQYEYATWYSAAVNESYAYMKFLENSPRTEMAYWSDITFLNCVEAQLYGHGTMFELDMEHFNSYHSPGYSFIYLIENTKGLVNSRTNENWMFIALHEVAAFKKFCYSN